MGKLSAPVSEIIERLKFHAGTGELAAGLIVNAIPVKRVEGMEDLPNVTVRVPGMTESAVPGGRMRGHAHGEQSVVLELATKREDGWPGLLAWQEKVMDAIFTQRTGDKAFDPGLAGTVQGMPTVSATLDSTLDVSLSADITIRLMTREYLPNQRRT